VTECPSNVDLAHLKAELTHARNREEGVPLTDRIIAAADLLGRLGTSFPALANAALRWRLLRWLMKRVLGFDSDAPIPPFASERFDRWFARRDPSSGRRGRVILWDDTWVRYHEPSIGRAAVEVLEALGYEVGVAEDRVCCGRPAASRGLLEKVRRAAERNVRVLAECSEPVIFLEPSCWSMFQDEYRQMAVPGADAVAERCLLFEDFVRQICESDRESLPFTGPVGQVAIHAHCHAKALADAKRAVALLEKLPGASVKWLETGCCGMAGAFGMLSEHRELAIEVAKPLVAAIGGLSRETAVVASGTSCRHQIGDLTDRQPLHVAELLANYLASPP
jgi:Fe-S oxidoreductase